jgi:hypothetical protein
MQVFSKNLFKLHLVKPILNPKEVSQRQLKIEFDARLGACMESVDSMDILVAAKKFKTAKIILPHIMLELVNVGLTAYGLPILKELVGWQSTLRTTGNDRLEKSLEDVAGFIEMPLDIFINTKNIFEALQACLDELMLLAKKNFPPTPLDIYKIQRMIRIAITLPISILIIVLGSQFYLHYLAAKLDWEAGNIDFACEKSEIYCGRKEKIKNLTRQCEDELELLHFEKAQSYLEEGKKINTKALAVLDEKINNSVWEINQALARYHTKNGIYPIGTGPEGNFTPDGKFKTDWIQGLAPEYIDSLPRDPRNRNSRNDQYFYWSDGKDYKLIRHGADDCDSVKRLKPEMIDPVRDCWAYGYWTPNAAKW